VTDRIHKDRIVILADVSPSMADADGGMRERKTRFDLLKEALKAIPKDVLIITFSGDTREIHNGSDVQLDMNRGGTALHLAINAAAQYRPIKTVIISDGEPDSEPLARQALEGLTGIVDVVYCGNPNNTAARAFLESLARAGAGGFYQTGDQVDVAKQLPAVIAGLLKS
jgi:hypothetical protein